MPTDAKEIMDLAMNRQETLCRMFVLALLYQNIEDIAVPTAFAPLMGQAFFIYSTPQVSPFTSNHYDVNLIHDHVSPGVPRRFLIVRAYAGPLCYTNCG